MDSVVKIPFFTKRCVFSKVTKRDASSQFSRCKLIFDHLYFFLQDPQFCVLCSRKVTQKLFYDILFTGAEVNGVIQRYGNLCNIPGEYARECMLICPRSAPVHCMPLPIMSHQRNKYAVRINCGMRQLTQVMVGYEDFATPSTKEQS